MLRILRRLAGSGRMEALAAVTAGMQAAGAIASVGKMLENGTGIKVSVSLGNTKSESTSAETTSAAVGSQVAAAGNLSIKATGGGQDSNLTAIGSDISGGGNVTLAADNAIALLAAENTSSLHSTNSSSGTSIGIGYSFGGSQNGFSLDLAASRARGNADGDDLSYTNSHVSAGNTATLQSGGDTTIKGGVVAGSTVVANVGGDLNIESLQDKATYDSKQASAGFSLSLCIPPVCYGASTASGSVSKAKVEGDFLSVTEQSGIQAGDGGFQVKVGGNTDLIGGVISSNQAAIDQNKNSLSTASLTYSDLQNKDVYAASGFSVSASVSGKDGNQSDASTDKQKSAAKDADSAKPGAGAGFGSASGSQSSTTASAISGGTLTITDAAKQAQTGQDAAAIARDVTTENSAQKAGALTQAWNGQQLMAQVQAQTAIVQAFGKEATTAIGDYAAAQIKKADEFREKANAASEPDRSALIAQAQALEDKWGDQGNLRLLAHTIVGGLTGGVNGALGATAGTLSAPEVANALSDAGLDPDLTKTLTAIASTAAGAAVGGAAGAGAALDEVVNNYLTHAQIDAKAAALAKATTAKEKADIEATYKALDESQKVAAEDCMVSNECKSVTDPSVLKQVFTDLEKSCAPPRLCSSDAKKSIAELWPYFGSPDAIKPIYPVEEMLLINKAITLVRYGFLYGASLYSAEADVAAVSGRVTFSTGANSTAPFSPIVDGGGLQSYENAGGHLLEKHVGQTEQALMDRLAADPRITGSSSFYDRATAESAMSQALDANKTVISDWLSGSTGRLRIDYSLPDPVGISVFRGATGSVDVRSLRTILVRDPSMPTGYKILTGFPTKP